jgi:hypothetical protein
MRNAEKIAQREIDGCKMILHRSLALARRSDQAFAPLRTALQALAPGALSRFSGRALEIEVLRLAVQELAAAGITAEVIVFALGEYAAEHPEWRPAFKSLSLAVTDAGFVEIIESEKATDPAINI